MFRGNSLDEVYSPSQILLHCWHMSKAQNDSKFKNHAFRPNFSENEFEAFQNVECKQTYAFWNQATFRGKTCFFIFEVIWVISRPGAWATHPKPSWAKTCLLGCKHYIYHTDIPWSRNTAIFTLMQIYAFGNWKHNMPWETKQSHPQQWLDSETD
jgi:hypothetical protein